MRKRGLPKSPVRENRTPGSVRGAPRRPYRDWRSGLLRSSPVVQIREGLFSRKEVGRLTMT